MTENNKCDEMTDLFFRALEDMSAIQTKQNAALREENRKMLEEYNKLVNIKNSLILKALKLEYIPLAGYLEEICNKNLQLVNELRQQLEESEEKAKAYVNEMVAYYRQLREQIGHDVEFDSFTTMAFGELEAATKLVKNENLKLMQTNTQNRLYSTNDSKISEQVYKELILEGKNLMCYKRELDHYNNKLQLAKRKGSVSPAAI